MKWNKINESKEATWNWREKSDKLVEDIYDFLKVYIEQVIYGSPANVPAKKRRVLDAMKTLEQECGVK